MIPMKLLAVGLVVAAALSISCGPAGRTSGSAAQPNSATTRSIDVVKVVEQKLKMKVSLPGELWPYEVVAIYPKITGFVQWIGVDRGSHVRAGELIVRLEAPEITAQRAEAQAKLRSAESQRIEGEAKLAADESTYRMLMAAAQTPGVVAGNDLVIAQKSVDADRARVKALEDNKNAARQALRSVEETEAYLRITAPFDGVVTERNVHPGALVGPSGGPGVTVSMVRIETLARLRLVIPVPETYIAGIPVGTKVDFTVPAFPGRVFGAPVARISHAVDLKTRTMPVELEVRNPSGQLAPGTFAQVLWPVTRPQPTLFVPVSAVARTTERTFVVRIRQGKAEWLDVSTGATSGNLIEVFGDLHPGDEVVLRGTDELRPGTAVTPHLASSG